MSLSTKSHYHPASTFGLQPFFDGHSLFFRDPFFRQLDSQTKIPAFDLIETPHSFVVKADVPGYSKDQIEIDVEGSSLSIKGHWVKEKEEKDKVHLAKERSESSFQRTIKLADKIDAAKITAALKDGVLQVTVPKDQVKAEAAKITIQ